MEGNPGPCVASLTLRMRYKVRRKPFSWNVFPYQVAAFLSPHCLSCPPFSNGIPQYLRQVRRHDAFAEAVIHNGLCLRRQAQLTARSLSKRAGWQRPEGKPPSTSSGNRIRGFGGPGAWVSFEVTWPASSSPSLLLPPSERM